MYLGGEKFGVAALSCPASLGLTLGTVSLVDRLSFEVPVPHISFVLTLRMALAFHQVPGAAVGLSAVMSLP